MSLQEKTVLDALRTVCYPGFSRDIVALGVVRNLHVESGIVEFEIALGPAPAGIGAPIEQAARAALTAVSGVREVKIRLPGPPGRPAGSASSLRMAGPPRPVAGGDPPDAGLLPEVRHTIAVASGKGGVGKSTIAVNLAAALASGGASVGLLDADVYGPSIPLMTGLNGQPELTAERRLIPFERFGVRIMSLGFLVPADSAVIWRGPMLVKALDQLLRDVVWGKLDYLIVDMPPGTGDVQLTLAQKVSLAGAIIVTTPQDVALADARKGVAMFQKVQVPILGIVENMSYFECPHCSESSEIFSRGGGRLEAKRLGVPLLAEVPLHAAIRIAGDTGAPLVSDGTDSAQSRIFHEMAERLCRALDAPDGSATETPKTGFGRRIRQLLNRSES